MMKLRVGIVGLGANWEQRYRPALKALSDRFQVRAVCAEVAAKAEQVARQFDAEPVHGFRVLAARPDIDAVLLLSSAWYGPLPIFAACDFAKAVYCTAAVAVDGERAEEIKRRIEESGIAFTAEFPRRQSPATLRLKELIATRLGPPQMLFCHARRQTESRPRPLLGNGSRREPMVEDLMELVDWCCFIMDRPPRSVWGVEHLGRGGKSDYQMMSVEFAPRENVEENPAMAQISCGRYLPPQWKEAVAFRPPAELQVCCEHGIAFVDLPATLVWFDDAGRHQESLDQDRPVGEQLLTQFHRAVTSLVRRTQDLEDAYRALQVVMAARESAQTGRRISLG